MNVKYSSNIQPCLPSDSSILHSNWVFWPCAIILKTFNWKSGGEKLGIIGIIHCIWSSSTAELAKLACSYNIVLRPRAVLSAHLVAPLYTVHDAEKCPPQAQNEYTMVVLSGIEEKQYKVRKEVKKLQLTLINMQIKCTRLHI
jgi:hypothetical protein